MRSPDGSYSRKLATDNLSSEEKKNLHHSPAGKADENHKEPAGDQTECPDTVTHGDAETVLRDPAVCRVHGALVRGNILVGLLGVDLVESVGGNRGGVQADDVERRLGAFGAILCLRDLEIPNTGDTGHPGRAQNRVRLAVQGCQVGGGRVCGKQKNGFL